MYKINHMKKVIEDQCLFRRYVKVRQEASDEIQTIISHSKDEFKISIENNIISKTRKEILFLFNGDGLKSCLL